MIKQDLIQRVVDRTGLPRTKAEQAVETVFRGMKQALVAGERIELRGFGVFTIKPRKTGIGRNPRTGTEVSIEPGRAVRFRPGRELQSLAHPTTLHQAQRVNIHQQALTGNEPAVGESQHLP